MMGLFFYAIPSNTSINRHGARKAPATLFKENGKYAESMDGTQLGDTRSERQDLCA